MRTVLREIAAHQGQKAQAELPANRDRKARPALRGHQAHQAHKGHGAPPENKENRVRRVSWALRGRSAYGENAAR